VPRVAHTRMQRLRAARTMSLLAEDSRLQITRAAIAGGLSVDAVEGN